MITPERSYLGAAAPDRVEGLLEEQARLFARLEGLGAAQGAMIDADDAEGLLGVLAERQRIIEEVGRTNAELDPVRARWDQFIAGLPEAERDRLRRRIDAIAEAAARVAAGDEADRRRLEARREAVAVELSQLSRGQGAVAAYGGTSAGGPRFQDREA